MNSVMAIGEKVVFIYKGEKAWEALPEIYFKPATKN
jgi:hypothetical protein